MFHILRPIALSPTTRLEGDFELSTRCRAVPLLRALSESDDGESLERIDRGLVAFAVDLGS